MLPEYGRVEQEAEAGGDGARRELEGETPSPLENRVAGHPERDRGDADGHRGERVDGEGAAGDERGPRRRWPFVDDDRAEPKGQNDEESAERVPPPVDGVVDERRKRGGESSGPESGRRVIEPAGREERRRHDGNAGGERDKADGPNSLPKRLQAEVRQERVEDLVIGPVVRRRDRPDGPHRVLLERRSLVPPHGLVEVAEAEERAAEDDEAEQHEVQPVGPVRRRR